MRRSIIISYKESGKDRRNNLKRLLHYLSWLLDNETEIVLVEQDTESKIDWLKEIKKYEFINHIFVKNDGIFNKGWGYNIGVKAAKGNYLVFNDSDVFIKLDTYRSAIYQLNNFDVINPYKTIYYLDEKNTSLFISNNYNFNITRTITDFVVPGVISGGIFMMKKDTYLSLKGFDEDCFGYGHEDDIFDVKIRQLGLSINVINELAVHIYHQGTTQTDDYYSFEDINNILFSEYKNMTVEQLRDKIKETNSFGEINKDNISNEFSIEHLRMQLYQDAAETILDGILKNTNTDFLDNLIKESTEKALERAQEFFIESFAEKLEEEFSKIKFTEKDKKAFLQKIMKRKKL